MNTQIARYKIGDKLRNRYDIAQIHYGSMGIVYLCLDVKYKTVLALKSFQDKYLTNDNIKKRFITEATNWLKIGYHSNIVFAKEIEVFDGKPFLILDGVYSNKRPLSIADVIKSRTLNKERATEWAIQICFGMHFVNLTEPNLVHRDLKPSNILIKDSVAPRISDFGVIKVHETELLNSQKRNNTLNNEDLENKITNFDEIVGTIAYMSPEQYQGDILDVRSDIYSFGCILYEMYTGKNYKTELLLNNKNDKIVFEQVNSELETIIKMCVQEKKQNRYDSFLKIGSDLEYYLKNTYKRSVNYITRELIDFERLLLVESRYNNTNTLEKAIKNKLQMRKYINTSADMNFRKANSLMEINEYSLANDFMLIAIKDFEENKPESITQILNNNKVNEVQAEILYKNQLANLIVSYANSEQGIQNYESAYENYKKAIELNDKNSNAWYNLGELCFNIRKETEESIIAYKKTLELNPRDYDAWISLGHVYFSLLKIQKALDCLNKGLEINPKHEIGLGNKGEIFYKLGQLNESEKIFKEIIRINPGNAYAFVYLYYIQRKKGNEELANKYAIIANKLDSSIKL